MEDAQLTWCRYVLPSIILACLCRPGCKVWDTNAILHMIYLVPGMVQAVILNAELLLYCYILRPQVLFSVSTENISSHRHIPGRKCSDAGTTLNFGTIVYRIRAATGVYIICSASAFLTIVLVEGCSLPADIVQAKTDFEFHGVSYVQSFFM